jgi:hypothetical protein
MPFEPSPSLSPLVPLCKRGRFAEGLLRARQKLSFESALINSGDVQTHANLIFNGNREFYLRMRFAFRVLRTIKTSPSSVKFATCTIPSLPWACSERVLLALINRMASRSGSRATTCAYSASSTPCPRAPDRCRQDHRHKHRRCRAMPLTSRPQAGPMPAPFQT